MCAEKISSADALTVYEETVPNIQIIVSYSNNYELGEMTVPLPDLASKLGDPTLQTIARDTYPQLAFFINSLDRALTPDELDDAIHSSADKSDPEAACFALAAILNHIKTRDWPSPDIEVIKEEVESLKETRTMWPLHTAFNTMLKHPSASYYDVASVLCYVLNLPQSELIKWKDRFQKIYWALVTFSGLTAGFTILMDFRQNIVVDGLVLIPPTITGVVYSILKKLTEGKYSKEEIEEMQINLALFSELVRISDDWRKKTEVS